MATRCEGERTSSCFSITYTYSGSFCVAFQTITDSIQWAVAVQEELVQAEWDEDLLAHPAAAEEWGGKEDHVLFKGLRVRIGMNYGAPRAVRDPMTRRIEFIGPVVSYDSADRRVLTFIRLTRPRI